MTKKDFKTWSLRNQKIVFVCYTYTIPCYNLWCIFKVFYLTGNK